MKNKYKLIREEEKNKREKTREKRGEGFDY